MRGSGFEMGLGKFSRPLLEVGVIEMPKAGVDTNRRVEVPPYAGLLQLRVTGVVVGVLIDIRWVADKVEVT